MHELYAVAAAHPVYLGIAVYWVYSAAVSALPAPDSADGKGYNWLYKFLHTIAGNISAAFGSKIPGIEPPKSN